MICEDDYAHYMVTCAFCYGSWCNWWRVFISSETKILFIQESGEMKISLMARKSILNFILVHTNQEFTTKLCAPKETTFL
jgi:hypothetical protein